MTLYRIARAARAGSALSAFSGDGSAKYPGRWNHKGARAVYCSDSLALACLETLVHIRPLPRVFPPSVYYELEIDDAVLERPSAGKLPSDWHTPVVSNATRDFGTTFLTARRAVGLRLPTALIPVGWTILLNPLHDDFKIERVKGPLPFYYDSRLE